jgi:hypothetical protein
MKMIDWLNTNFTGIPPSKQLARRAIRHLKKKEKIQLFSHEISQMRAAEGRWYESLIYEMVLDISSRTELISGVFRKGADAPFPPVEVALGQSGLFYSSRGDVNVRGNGQDLAEVDLLLQSSSGAIAFAEIVTSPADLKGLEDEIQFKKCLLGYIFGQVHVPFLLFSSVDISRSSIVKRLIREPDSVLIVTNPCEEIKALLKPRDIRGIPRKPIQHPKFISLDKITPPREFDYKKIHDLRRSRVLNQISLEGKFEPGKGRDEIPPIVKKILLGALYPSGIRVFLRETGFSIKGNVHSYDDIMKQYTKIILAVDLPGYDPVLYFRLRNKKEYLKVVPNKKGEFRIESRRGRRIKGFFLWLESVEPTLGAGITRQYIHSILKKK